MEKFNNLDWDIITASLALRYLINLMAVLILIKFIYYRNYKRRDLDLTFFAFNSIIFFVTYMLNKVEMSTGAAFGLFAVFSILRYRTEGIAAKDMTYLFLSIAIGLLTAVSKGNWIEQSIICFTILCLTFLLETNFFSRKENIKTIFYDNVRLIHTDSKEALLADLKSRTGLNIHRFEITEIDFLKDACRITIHYFEN
jgi:Domain of unknown function (DUF4956)